mmetsp:Transcript_18773/g.28885  ORF Transcript_18773/g.28885 Transcript_18773/m.28885 type:complete len:173 (-) Transcript_18773:2807-3325(-)
MEEQRGTTTSRDKSGRPQKVTRSRAQENLQFTIRQDTLWIKVWNILFLFICLFSSLQYPYVITTDYPSMTDRSFWTLAVIEGFYFIEIILKFFMQDLDEEGNSKAEPLEVVATRYLNSGFLIDLIAFIPWGYIMGTVDPRLKFFWVVKALRIRLLNHYLSNKVILPPVKMYI